MSRFSYVAYSKENAQLQESAKALSEQLEELINGLPSGRATLVALTKLEETYMWIGKAIRDKQINEGGNSTHRPERNSE